MMASLIVAFRATSRALLEESDEHSDALEHEQG
jgi:hypothetical protein